MQSWRSITILAIREDKIIQRERYFMKCKERSVFVLDIAGRPTFAFEAETPAQAEDFIRAPWFGRSLDEFYAKKRSGWDKNISGRVRVATEGEMSIYRDFADEFAVLSNCFFIAHLSDLVRER
jgi:hypothetical protein